MKKEILVPTSASEVPLKRYQDLMSADPLKQQDFKFTMSCLTGCDESDVYYIQNDDMERAANALVKTLNDTQAPLVKKVKIDGVEYGLEPRLDKISFGMMADLFTFFEDVEYWHKAVAILYRPIIRTTTKLGGLYAIDPHIVESESYLERQRIFQNGPASLFIGVRAFFLNGSIRLNHFIQSLVQDQSRTQKQENVQS